MVALLIFAVPGFLAAQRGGGSHGGGSGGFGGGAGGGSHVGGRGYRTGLSSGFGGFGYGYGPNGFNAFGPTQPTAYPGNSGFVGRRGRGFNNGYGYGGYGGWGYWPYGYDEALWGVLDWDYDEFPPTTYENRQQQNDRENFYEGNRGPAYMRSSGSGFTLPRTEPPKMIEVPQQANAAPQSNQPTVFVLTNGQRIESRDYVLSDRSLKVQEGRQQRTIPLDQVNVDATVAANQQRGIDLTIPRDRNSLFLSF